jgi:uncharacterized protein (DUF1330 family)
MASVDPTGQDLKRLLAEDDGQPIVMLNLLKFTQDGRASYEKYAGDIMPFLDRVSATVVYLGDASTSLVAPDTFDFDAVLLVRYPSRRAFCDMVADPEYQQITHLRTQALSSAVLQATTSW